MSSEEPLGFQVATSTQAQPHRQPQSETQQFRQKQRLRESKSGFPWLVEFIKDDVRLYFSPLTAIVREFRQQIKS
jgi:hypothetical protein